MNPMSVETSEPTGERTRARRGVAFYVGLALVLAGLGLLGYVGWQFYGTNIVAKQAQERVMADLREEWRAPVEPAPAAAPEPTTGPVLRPEPEVPLGKASALVRIPRFGDDYVIPVLEGIGDDELASGYGHFPRTADPGERGNYALAAHRVTHGEPLRDMPKLRPGDEVLIETRNAIYTYELDTNPNELIVGFEDIWVIDRIPTNPDGGVQPPSQEPGQRLITLTTCAELFHTDDRMIAFGHLVDAEPKERQ
jgi:sortase A